MAETDPEWMLEMWYEELNELYPARGRFLARGDQFRKHKIGIPRDRNDLRDFYRSKHA